MNYQDMLVHELASITPFHHNATTQTVPAMIVQYIGSQASATVEVAAGGDVTFKHGAASSEAADATIKLPSGGSDGVLDVSDTTADTFGEICDHINASANWRCILVGARRSDSTNNTLAALSATQAKVSTLSGPYRSAGVPLYLDEQVGFKVGFSITNKRYTGINAGSANKGGDQVDDGMQNELSYIAFKSTYGSGSSAFSVYIVNDSTNEEVLVASFAGGATTVAAEKDFFADGGINYKAPLGWRILVQLANSAAMTMTQLTGHGKVTRRESA